MSKRGQPRGQTCFPSHLTAIGSLLLCLLPPAALAVKLLLVLANAPHVAVGPDARADSTDADSLWFRHPPIEEPSDQRQLVNSDHLGDLCCGVSPHAGLIH